MLIPTIGPSPGAVQWLFIQANPPDQPLSPSWIPESVRQNILCLDIDDLRSYRSFVGNVKASGAENNALSLRLAREISPTISTSGMGIFGATFGAESEDYAVKVVTESRDVILREAYADEKTLFLITKLKEIFLAIEQRKDQRMLQNESTKRIPGVSGPYLRGWELIDIATCKPSPEKGTKLNVDPTDSWYKIARDNEDMIVFFSKGMADAIRPTAARQAFHV
ncbi:unnamed protein product [Penicillium pancosmium]